ncbi:ATP-binding protein [Streptomyces sp. NPDC052013]|uniref:ATP-binding protein n=1 Tax=unclassified Streptomyces TaxID=2593676 RepID=UPI0034509B55
MSAQVLPEPAGPMRLLAADLSAVTTEPEPRHDACVALVSAGAEDVSRIRRVAHDFLVGLRVRPTTREDVLLVVSELVTNAVTHALPPAALRLRRTARSTLRIEVTDGGPRPCRPPRLDPTDEHGRGMQIVAALAAHHGTITDEQGATRWAELRL